MLVIQRRFGEGIWVGDTWIKVEKSKGHANRVRLAIEAKPDVKVVRAEKREGHTREA